MALGLAGYSNMYMEGGTYLHKLGSIIQAIHNMLGIDHIYNKGREDHNPSQTLAFLCATCSELHHHRNEAAPQLSLSQLSFIEFGIYKVTRIFLLSKTNALHIGLPFYRLGHPEVSEAIMGNSFHN